MMRAKLFCSGRSQAVRLPAAFRFEGTEVEIERDPVTAAVVLTPLRPTATALLELRDELLKDPDFQAEIAMVFDGLRDSRPVEPVVWI